MGKTGGAGFEVQTYVEGFMVSVSTDWTARLHFGTAATDSGEARWHPGCDLLRMVPYTNAEIVFIDALERRYAAAVAADTGTPPPPRDEMRRYDSARDKPLELRLRGGAKLRSGKRTTGGRASSNSGR